MGPWRTNWKPVLGEAGLLHELAAEHNLPVADLNRGFALIPLTKAVLAELGDLDPVLERWSTRGPVAHVTGETHAGYGSQTARLFDNGRIRFAQEGLAYSGPISMLLHRMGVTGGKLGWDEFDIVGLGRHRRTERWVPDL
ncbi:hypothetical protein GCM10029964_028070 [Kibdelosporangium lantanae]